ARLGAILLGIVGVSGSVAWNLHDVSMRGYDLAERFGRFHLENLEPDSILLLESDDALATARYLQGVKGFRRDLLVIDAGRLPYEWYVAHLQKRDGRLK